ncbi:MAG: putative peptidoglycan glycosyltransferase FtsW [Parvularculaceae bacterium]|nr:putative peptidoglycan glycosyltransferase FtsW [Parvularculaceae bacterium]
MKGLSRIDESPAARWWWSVDHTSLGILGALMTIGVVLLFAAGPGAAARFHIDDSFHFPLRQIVFLAPALFVIITASALTPLQARRAGAVLFAMMFVALLAALLFAPEINGAKRWFAFGPFSFQPSEFLKPGFVIVIAWMLAEGARNPRFPGAAIACGLYIVCAGLLALQPDYGQAGLLTMVFMAMYFVSGGGLLLLTVAAAAAAGLFTAGYFFSPHLAARIDAFLNPGTAESYQTAKALEAIANGGLIGRADSAAPVKFSLPDAHTDFIFAVAAEEYGMIVCATIIALLAALVVRAYVKAGALKSTFAQTAVCGLAALIGLQSLINIGVNLRALPAKGMTLPFISYGGSSLIAAGLTVGLLLALTRRQSLTDKRKDVMP